MRNEFEYAKILESTGLSRKDAERHLRVIYGAIMDNVARKEDIILVKGEIKIAATELKQETAELRTELKQEITEVRTELKQDIADLRVELKQDMANLKTELKQDIADLKTELKQDMADLRVELKTEIIDLRSEIKTLHDSTIRTLGGLMIVLFGLLATADQWSKFIF